jgi:hypothetical protein
MATFKIPSIDLLASEIKRVSTRFPLSVASAVLLLLTTYLLIGLEENYKSNAFQQLIKFSLVISLGISLFTALHLWIERQTLPEAQKWGILGGFMALLLVYFFILPDADEVNFVTVSRHAVFVAVVHLLVAFLPYWGRQEDNGFWYFNLILFGRVLLTAIYCFFLGAGILGALGVIQALFGLKFDFRVYLYIANFIAILVSTFVFLAGVPLDYKALQEADVHPEGLKIFTQYILVPLISIYGGILYAYGLMILFTWNLPKGMVIGLMIGFCTWSMLGILFVYPIRHKTQNTWVKMFGDVFYRAILPLMLLYFVAIGKRVWQYGITPDRYFVIVAGLWLVAIAVYFIISKEKRIIYIPLTLAIVGLASVVGPWSAYSVSAYSQAARFAEIFVRNKTLNNGQIDITKFKNTKISETDQKEIRSIVSFFAEQGRVNYLQSYFKADLAKEKNKVNRTETNNVLAILGMVDEDTYKQNESQKYGNPLYFYASAENWRKIEGYQYSLKVDFNGYQTSATKSSPIEYELDKMRLSAVLDYKEGKIQISQQDKIIISINLLPTIENLAQKKTGNISQSDLTIITEGGKYKAMLKIETINILQEMATKKYNRVRDLRGELFLRMD